MVGEQTQISPLIPYNSTMHIDTTCSIPSEWRILFRASIYEGETGVDEEDGPSYKDEDTMKDFLDNKYKRCKHEQAKNKVIGWE